METYYKVTYRGYFGFIKPWSAVKDSFIVTAQYLTPSVVRGMELKLGIEGHILRHKITHQGIRMHQETIKARQSSMVNNIYGRLSSILRRGVMAHPVLELLFESEADAQVAVEQHLCLCRNEDLMLPDNRIDPCTLAGFDQLPGFEMQFGESPESVFLGYHRYTGSDMMGYLTLVGEAVQIPQYDF